LGTRVATYGGAGEEVPLGYECVLASPDYGLKFWAKTSTIVGGRILWMPHRPTTSGVSCLTELEAGSSLEATMVNESRFRAESLTF